MRKWTCFELRSSILVPETQGTIYGPPSLHTGLKLPTGNSNPRVPSRGPGLERVESGLSPLIYARRRVRVLVSSARTVTGSDGSAQDHRARFLHRLSPRPLFAIACSAAAVEEPTFRDVGVEMLSTCRPRKFALDRHQLPHVRRGSSHALPRANLN